MSPILVISAGLWVALCLVAHGLYGRRYRVAGLRALVILVLAGPIVAVTLADVGRGVWLLPLLAGCCALAIAALGAEDQSTRSRRVTATRRQTW